MIEPIAAWHQEHERFARILDFLEGQMAAFHNEGQPDYDLMRDAILYLRDFGDRSHHPREDVAFARLVAREPNLELAVNRLLQEHRVIAVAGDVLLDCLENVLNDVVTERKTVESAAATYLVYYRHHLATEEGEIMPRATCLLTADDWAAVANAVETVSDPLFGSVVDARYRVLRERALFDQPPTPAMS